MMKMPETRRYRDKGLTKPAFPFVFPNEGAGNRIPAVHPGVHVFATN
jgi:hypothetical protein